MREREGALERGRRREGEGDVLGLEGRIRRSRRRRRIVWKEDIRWVWRMSIREERKQSMLRGNCS